MNQLSRDRVTAIVEEMERLRAEIGSKNGLLAATALGVVSCAEDREALDILKRIERAIKRMAKKEKPK